MANHNCPNCDKTFGSVRQLTQHVLESHKDIPLETIVLLKLDLERCKCCDALAHRGQHKTCPAIECACCLDDFKSNYSTLECGHPFCNDCLVRQLDETGNRCPICRARFVPMSGNAVPHRDQCPPLMHACVHCGYGDARDDELNDDFCCRDPEDFIVVLRSRH